MILLKYGIKLSKRIKIELHLGDTFAIGRGPYCDFQLDQAIFEEDEDNLHHNKSSRVHMLLANESGTLILYDKSANGTYVNGTKVDKTCLSSGDKVAILKDDYDIFYFQENKAGK